jgi:colanic acid biosynthesis glycosyl transferase WcaI
MKVLLVSQYFFPEQFLVNHLSSQLVEDGHDVTVICAVPNYPDGRFMMGHTNRKRRTEEWKGVKIRRVLTIPRGKSSFQLLINYLVYPVMSSLEVIRERRKPPDVCLVSQTSPIVQALAGIIAKRLWRIPLVFWVVDLWPDSAIALLNLRSKIAISALRALSGYLYRQADLVMVQGDSFHEVVSDLGVSRERIATLTSFAPPSFVPLLADQVDDRIRKLVPRSQCTIVFAGNLGRSQDLDVILDAVLLLPEDLDLQILIIGSGRDGDRITERVRLEGLDRRIVLLGRRPETEMPGFFACADALLVTLRDEEVFAHTVPAKVQAYLACGKPIIGSLRGEGSSVIQKAKAGFVASPSSPQELRDVLYDFARMSEDERATYGRNGRLLFEQQYSLRAVTDRLYSHLSPLIPTH